MDCLDTDNLELLVLRALAENYASEPNDSGKATTSSVIVEGLPGTTASTTEDVDLWGESEVNHVLSYCRYVQSLPVSSERLPSTLDTLKPLVQGLWSGMRPNEASGSSGRMVNFKQVSEMTSVILQALFHIGESPSCPSGEIVGVFEEFLLVLADKMTNRDESVLATALTILTSCHEHMLTYPIELDSSSQVSCILAALRLLASEQVIETLDAVNSNPSPVSSPASTSDKDGDIRIRLDDSVGGQADATPQYAHVQRRRSSIYPPHLYEQIAILRRFSGMDLVLLVLDMQGSVLCQSLAPVQMPDSQPSSFARGDRKDEHFASNASWLSLNQVPVHGTTGDLKLGRSEEGHVVLQDIASAAVKWWDEIMHGSGIGLGVGVARRFADRGQGAFGGGLDYGENAAMIAILKLLTLASLHAEQVDEAHRARLRFLLNDKGSPYHAGVLEMTLACIGIFVLNFPYLATSTTPAIRRFATTPLPALETEMADNGVDIPEVVFATARCLSICVKTAPNDDLINSTLYSLMNAMPHGQDTSSIINRSLRGGIVAFADYGREKSPSIPLENRKSAAASTIGLVSRFALEINRPETIQVTVSMLLQRLNGADPIMERAIINALVPLVLKANDDLLLEVVQAFAAISRSSNPEDPRTSSNAVLAGLTFLAQGLGSRQKACSAFLAEMLSLFIDKGLNVQSAWSQTSGHKSSSKASGNMATDTLAELAALLLPIDAVLANSACDPCLDPSPDVVGAFRDMWFLCVVYGFTRPNNTYINDTGRGALRRIALKTPALILERDKDYVNSGLEYNPVFRRDYAHTVLPKQRNALAELIPKRANEIRNFSMPQVTLVQTVHDLEMLRTMNGRPSVILGYFCNDSLNDSPISTSLEAVADKLIHAYLAGLSSQVLDHDMPDTVSEEVRKMMVATTHRYAKVRQIAVKYLNAILTSFAALMCDRKIVFTLLEVLTLLRRSCEDELVEEVRNSITRQLYELACKWLDLAVGRAPIEMQSILQHYLRESRDTLLLDQVEMGAGLAMQYAKAISRSDRQETLMPRIGGWVSDSANLLASQFAAKNYFSGELSGARWAMEQGLGDIGMTAPNFSSVVELTVFRKQMTDALQNVRMGGPSMGTSALRRLLLRATAVLISSPVIERDILHCLVALPLRTFTALGIAAGVDAWTWLVAERPDVEVALLAEITDGWLWTIQAGRGLFSDSMNSIGPFERPIEYSPTDKATLDHDLAVAKRMLQPHTLLTQVLSSRFQAVKYRDRGITLAFFRLLIQSFKAHKRMSTHPLAREVRFSLVLLGFQLLASSNMEANFELRFRDHVFNAALSWFSVKPVWSFGSNRIQLGAEIKLLEEVISAVDHDQVRGDHCLSALPQSGNTAGFSGNMSLRDYIIKNKERVSLTQLLLQNEISRLRVWANVTADPIKEMSSSIRTAAESNISSDVWTRMVRKAWMLSPAIAVHMGERFKEPAVHAEITRLVKLLPRAVIDVPEALQYLLGLELQRDALPAMRWLPLWAAVSPVTAVTYFQPRYGNHPLVLQYAMRSLEQYPVNLTFFFVPQVVQALRSDRTGYVERFIFETSKISQLFCHQIIWNMKANCYKDDGGEVEDPMKPTLDRMVDLVVSALSGKARAFYDLEFNFFNEVTSISGKLKPFIKKSKPEKKAKIDEEMAIIEVKVGVYLPSNPDGVVVDIDKKSGRPLQSHAKASSPEAPARRIPSSIPSSDPSLLQAPFMATFKVRKEKMEYGEAEDDTAQPADGGDTLQGKKVQYEVWQAAIFKVGDDCRQDVLALQIIAMFKNVFMKSGLVLYLFPYRVTATAPGCGVIDVVPNATSRDEMGRAKINNLYSYFVDKYGSPDTTAFQKARLNFIQSMAAYSVACYILQIKDRHNGNIMIDGEGHIVHIDFGFLFDIGPGGVKFEPNSFKLSHEMVVLMGGRESQGYRMFQELTVKAFLAIRPFADQLVDTVHLMLGTGLPSFKGEPTIKRLRDRFQTHLSERAAADYMMGVIKNAHENYRSTVYDGFQKAQNGIPY
ncbi:hypothetical protein QFC20_003058 [Naganishia adeliensis]|uniref:Uncharacterized protein n=1 Tax=Naganishia adeliensis TaxID=92952 RepID=A0ACC2WGL5_9TREE|nr:hypothetical protein QFC20_003058 [Naganishia adeliensis]